MIRFYLFMLFAHPAMDGLDFYLRMDTDSFLTAPIQADPFVEMASRGLHYGWVGVLGHLAARSLARSLDSVLNSAARRVASWRACPRAS